MKQIVRRYLTLNPRMLSSRDLKALVDKLHRIHEADFRSEYQAWKEKLEGLDRTSQPAHGRQAAVYAPAVEGSHEQP